MRHGVFVGPFGPLADPALVARMAAKAEVAGWDGFFLWDHVFYVGVDELADPWITLAAVAVATERLVVGPMVTPLARRRLPKLARETLSLDRLSGGRLVFGVGVGSDRTGEFDRPGEEPDARKRAAALDDGLTTLHDLWAGAAIPVWVGSKGRNPAPLRRAARWHGWFPVAIESPDQFAEGAAAIRAQRAADGRGDEPYELAIAPDPGRDPADWAGAGATWLLTNFGSHPDADDVAAVIGAGPPRV
ncbi:MAG: LLM class flavin-dependent oxidoreductase [Acidimicrobiales bacterium]